MFRPVLWLLNHFRFKPFSILDNQIKRFTMNLKKIVLLTIASLLFVFSPNLQSQTKFTLPDLAYEFNALEPFIDSTTMNIHYSKHHAGYVNNLNNAIKDTEAANLSLEDIFKNMSKFSTAIRNNAGGHYNHTLFWSILTPEKNTMPSDRLSQAIQHHFNGLDSLKIKLNAAAASRFGSGWAWLIVTPEKKLAITSTPNQDNPLMDIAEVKGVPILGIDVWEHAYYLKYQNKRGDYLSALWNVINWNEVSRLFDVANPKGKFDDWPAIKDFHKVMAQTFHPSEEGNLNPIKTRIGEMVLKAEALKTSKIPAEFSSKEMMSAINQLINDSKKLQKMIDKKGTTDAEITKALSALHDVFHTIVGLCSDEHDH